MSVENVVDRGSIATATVVRGGNRLVRVTVPVSIPDGYGGIWWSGEATVDLQIPAGDFLPDVEVCERATARVVENV